MIVVVIVTMIYEVALLSVIVVIIRILYLSQTDHGYKVRK